MKILGFMTAVARESIDVLGFSSVGFSIPNIPLEMIWPSLPPSLPDYLLGDVQWDEEQPQGFSWCSKLSLQELGLPTQVRIRSQETRVLSMWKVKVATCLGTATLVNLPPIFPPVLLLSLCTVSLIATTSLQAPHHSTHTPCLLPLHSTHVNWLE